MWGALIAVSSGDDIVTSHGVRGGKAMIATLRYRLIRIPARLVRHADHLTLRPPARPTNPPTREPGATPGPAACAHTDRRSTIDQTRRSTPPTAREIGSDVGAVSTMLVAITSDV